METIPNSSWPSFISFDNLPCLVWYAQEPKFPIYTNKAWEGVCQKKVLDEIKKNWDFCIHPLDRIRRTITLQRSFSSQQGYELEYRLKTHANNYAWITEKAKPIFNLDDTFTGLLGICLDITDHKNHESTLMQLGTIIESSDDAIYSIDLDNHLLTWNRGAEELYGYDRKEIIGSQVVQKLIPKGKITEFINIRNRILSGENIEMLETVRKRKNGDLFDVSLSYSPLKDSDEAIIGLSVIARDISTQKEAQRDLMNTLAQLKNLIKHAPIGIAFMDKNLTYVTINEYLAAIDGLTVEEHIGRTPKDVLPDKLAKLVIPKLKEVYTTKTPQTFEIEGHTFANPHFIRTWSATYYPIELDRNQYGLGTIVQDITEQKILEKRKDDFISMASHELKTPVTSIKAFTQLIARTVVQDPQKEYIHKIENQTNRLIHIINEMLDVSKIRTGRFTINKELFDFDELVHEVVSNYNPTHPSHQVKVHGSSGQKVFADRTRISQVMINIASNAVKYSPQADHVDIYIGKDDKEVRFAVTDYGIGISKVNQSKIFQTFYRVVDIPDGEFPGLGIGLSIASQIIKLHGGQIGVKSSEGKGSTFWFTLPINIKKGTYE